MYILCRQIEKTVNFFYFRLFSFALRERNAVCTERNGVVKPDKVSVLLPQHLPDELVFFVVPGRKIVEQQSAGIALIRIQAPEGMIQAVCLNQFAKMCHPGEVRLAHEASPLADQKRRLPRLVDEEPVVAPAVSHQTVIIIVALKPRLAVYGRTVVMR